jgi:uncharacterized coiled-coil DUF342 family protein
MKDESDLAGLKRKNSELLAEIMRLKAQRNEARARVAELEARGILKWLMRAMGYQKVTPKTPIPT